MNLYTEDLIQILVAKAEGGIQMSEVFLVACGGSLVDLYPAKFFLASESRQLRSELYTANEFVHAVPKVLPLFQRALLIDSNQIDKKTQNSVFIFV